MLAMYIIRRNPVFIYCNCKYMLSGPALGGYGVQLGTISVGPGSQSTWTKVCTCMYLTSQMGYSFRLAASVLLYAPSHRQDNTYHGLCYTSRGALVGTRNSSVGPPHEESIRRPIAPCANALTTELHLAPPYVRRQITVDKMCEHSSAGPL